MDPFSVKAPGRLCLFGEHQDYLGLPVIALAIPLHCRMEVTPSTTQNRILELRVPALDQAYIYDLDQLPPRQSAGDKPDFALAAIYECLEEGWQIPLGAVIVSTSEIVMQAGCSSSTAFCVAWVLVLAKLAGKQQQMEDPIKLAQLAHRAEVLHFGAPGGTMDHMTIAIGGSCLRIGPGMWDVTKLRNLAASDGVWVLADSGEPKDTMGHLTRCKGDRLKLLDELSGTWDTKVEDKNLDSDKLVLLKATLTTRDAEEEAAKLWMGETDQGEEPTGEKLAALMLGHHEALRDGLHLSTPKLEAMRTAAIDAGAWGFKLVGSGGGGHGVAWTSHETAPAVAAAMAEAGAKSTWVISEPSEGAKLIC
jgi:galactokinase